MKELDQFTLEQLAKWIDAGKEAHDRHDGIRMAGVHVASLAKIALSVMVESEPHKRREIHAGGNTWIQCSKQALDRAEAAGERVRILYERPDLNSPVIPDGWVACSDRMPECGQWDHATVIVSEGNNSFIAYYNKRDGKFLDEPFGTSVGNKVTHWMPLPAAPKPEK